MRTIYYVPEGEDINDYLDVWSDRTTEVHNKVSDNIKEYIKDVDVAQWILIPEYKYARIPEFVSNQDFFEYYFYDDYAYYEDLPQYFMEVWKIDLDDPDIEPVKIETYPMQWEKVLCKFYTNHIQLETGWYELRFVKEGEVQATEKITVYESHEDLSDIISRTGQ
jgi:hypothetical protein